MRPTAKIKVAVACLPLRKATIATAAVAAMPRRVFPAWIDAGERGLAISPGAVTPRVRDGLVLRVVRQPKPTRARTPSHGSGAR